jgi:hypothetical protein
VKSSTGATQKELKAHMAVVNSRAPSSSIGATQKELKVGQRVGAPLPLVNVEGATQKELKVRLDSALRSVQSFWVQLRKN